MAVKKKKTVDRWKTKRWYALNAPKCFEEKPIGHTVASDPSQAAGRVVKATLKEITGNMSHQSIGLRFKISDVRGESASTEVLGHEMQRGYIMRQLKRMRSIINAIFTVKTKDGYSVRITAIAFARKKMTVSQESAIRKIIIEGISKQAGKTSFDKLFQEMAFGKISGDLFKDIKKIYPVARIEVTKSRVLSEGVPATAAPEAQGGAQEHSEEEKPKKAPRKRAPKKAEEPESAEEESGSE